MNIVLPNNNTFLQIDYVKTIIIKPKNTKTVVRSPWYSLKPDTVTEKTGWELEMTYVSRGGINMYYTVGNSDHAILKQTYNDIVQQIKDQDSKWADKQLEEAIINGGTK